MRHVLIIEDQILTRRCTVDKAGVAGATSAETVNSEADAIETARRHPPTVIVSVVDLNAGASGTQAVARIRELCGTVSAIFVTGQPDDRSAGELATVILCKPCTAAQFARTFDTVISELPRWRDVRGRSEGQSHGLAQRHERGRTCVIASAGSASR